jgi:rare lipoprotein A
MFRLRALPVSCGVLLCLFLAACHTAPRRPAPPPEVAAPPPPEAKGLYKVGQPYQVNGIWYYPQEDFTYDETGIASWYGPDFDEKFTANGEVFDQNQPSAAHKTLPMPSIVRVTNLENGRSILVRVNDRGPFIGNRVIDMSRRGAQLLGFEQQGTAKVRVQIMVPESIQAQSLAKMNGTEGGPPAEPPPPAVPRVAVVAEALPPPTGVGQAQPATPPPPGPTPPAQNFSTSSKPVPPGPALSETVTVVPVKPTGIYIQAGAFAHPEKAAALKAKLAPIGTVAISNVRVGSITMFRVRLGPIATATDADAMIAKLVAAGVTEPRIVVN